MLNLNLISNAPNAVLASSSLQEDGYAVGRSYPLFVGQPERGGRRHLRFRRLLAGD